MFKIKQEAVFPVALTLVGQGREQTLNVNFRAKPRSEYLALLGTVDYAKPETAIAAAVELVESWDADMPVGEEAMKLLAEHQPGAEFAILHAYTEALPVARKGN
jgi:hypothetical protein